MTRGKSAAVSDFIQELFRAKLYKRNQGRISRQTTFAVLALVLLVGLWRLHEVLLGSAAWLMYGLPAVLLLIGIWAFFRLVNVAVFADFLIAVEAEMNKVSWPTRAELIRGSAVVLIVIVGLAAVLFFFDFFWKWFFTDVLPIL